MAKGIFSRMTDIIRSNINELLDRAEEPDKMIRQMVREMEEAVSKATATVGTAIANQKRLERQHHGYVVEADDWQRKAERAVAAGHDDLARRALERKAVKARAAAELQPALDDNRETVEQLKEQLRELKTKLEEARTREGTLVARHQTAKARKHLAQSMSGLGGDAFSSFERFELRVASEEAEAEAHSELAGEINSLDREIRQLDAGYGEPAIELELDRLRRLVRPQEAGGQYLEAGAADVKATSETAAADEADQAPGDQPQGIEAELDRLRRKVRPQVAKPGPAEAGAGGAAADDPAAEPGASQV